jgi:hypothetical protein
MVRFLLLAAALALASPVQAEDKDTRERKVRVALALADASPKVVAVVPTKATVKLDWFGDDKPAAKAPAAAPVLAARVPCICGDSCKCAAGTCPGGCPVQTVAAPYYQQQCYVDQWGRQLCRWVLVQVPVGK